MKYVLFIHMFIKHFPKFPFLREKRKEDKQKYYLKDTIENWRFINKLLQTNKKKYSDIISLLNSSSVTSTHPMIPNQ